MTNRGKGWKAQGDAGGEVPERTSRGNAVAAPAGAEADGDQSSKEGYNPRGAGAEAGAWRLGAVGRPGRPVPAGHPAIRPGPDNGPAARPLPESAGRNHPVRFLRSPRRRSPPGLPGRPAPSCLRPGAPPRHQSMPRNMPEASP
jgi:hypothetical protein